MLVRVWLVVSLFVSCWACAMDQAYDRPTKKRKLITGDAVTTESVDEACDKFRCKHRKVSWAPPTQREYELSRTERLAKEICWLEICVRELQSEVNCMNHFLFRFACTDEQQAETRAKLLVEEPKLARLQDRLAEKKLILKSERVINCALNGDPMKSEEPTRFRQSKRSDSSPEELWLNRLLFIAVQNAKKNTHISVDYKDS